MQYFGTGRLGKAQNNIAYTATAGTTTALGSQTTKVRVVTTTDAFVLAVDPAGSDPTSSTGSFWPANSAEYITVSPGQTIRAVQSTAAGSLHVTEIS